MIARAPVLAAVLLCALSGHLGASGSLHCAMRREISPCTCRREEAGSGAIHVVCQRINNYEEIAKALTNKFSPMTKIGLDISYSQLPDFSTHSLRELGLMITRLKLNFDNLSALEENVFSELDLVDYFSLADNSLTELPRNVLKNLPHMKTLDLCRNKITQLTNDDFQVIQNVEHLLVADNEISRIEKNALPKTLKHIHLGLNNLSTLNGTLRDLDSLEWIFLNTNNLICIENELPVNAKKIVFIHAAQNKLQSLPKDFRQMPSLESLYFYHNDLKSLDGTLQKSKKLKRIGLSFNKIESLAEDEFLEAEALAELDIAYNHLKSLNGSLRKLRALRYLNLTNNLLPEFSFQEIKGLQRLSVIDLSHNKITFLTGNMENVVDVETRVLELRLDHNYLHNIGGAMMGLHGLLRLNLSHNSIQHITPDDFIGLDELRLLDISHNEISTLEETSKTFLPELEELLVHHNNITALDKVFHGLPSLCAADLSHNQIKNINYNFVSKTRCTINGVPSLLKIYLQENPVLCSDRIYELVSVLESFNARISGVSTCVRERTTPEEGLALGDGDKFKPVLIMSSQGLPLEDEVCSPDQPSNPFDYHPHHHHHLGPPMKHEAMGPLDNEDVLPPSSNNFMNWPKEPRRNSFAPEAPIPHSDLVQLRLVGGGYVAQ